MRCYQASSMIEATPEAVWQILVDGGSYTDWDSGLLALEGDVALGKRLKVTSEAKPGRAFPVRVTEVEPERSMRWSGGLPLGLFRGSGRSRSGLAGTQRRSSCCARSTAGPMLGLIGRSMPDLGPSFEKFARGLKERAERGA